MKCKYKSLSLLILIGFSLILMGCSKEKKTQGKYRHEVILIPKDAIEIQASVAEVYGDAKSIVTVVSDDGVYLSCKNIKNIFEKRGMKCTVAGVITNVKPYKDEWEELLENGTIDLVSHSYNHIKMESGSEIAQDIDALKHEIVDADMWYEEWLGNEQVVFVCPENTMCEIGYRIINENNFWAVRKGHRGYNSLSPEEGIDNGQWYNLMVQGIGDEGANIEVRNSWVDTAIDNRVWLIEMWHNVMSADDGAYQTISLQDAESHLDYMLKKSRENEIWVATFTDAVKYIREKQNSVVTAYMEGNEIHVFVEITNKKMSYNTFNQPLSVYVKLPLGCSVADESQILSGKNGCVLIDVIPGKETIINCD